MERWLRQSPLGAAEVLHAFFHAFVNASFFSMDKIGVFMEKRI
jgi:hypothetical protein